MTEQVGRQGVPGLVRDEMAEVHGVHPGPEPAVEPLVSERHRSVVAAVDRGEQCELGALRAGRPVAVAGGEPVQGLALAFGENIVETFGDPDRGVVVADLGLVVPEHREPAVAADAVPPDLDNLADPAAGGDGGLPDVAGPVVVEVVGGGELGEVGFGGQRLGDFVGKGRRAVLPVVAPAVGSAVMNSLSRPSWSAAPVSSASRSSLRIALNITDRVVVVTMPAAPPGRLTASDSRPSRSRCRWSATNRRACSPRRTAGS